jgi:hypothetical protein
VHPDPDPDPGAGPTRVLAADWSGAARPGGLWLATVGEDGVVTEVCAETRAGATRRLLAAADADPGIVAGLDFGFSLPAWWLRAQGISAAAELWADAGRLERWLAECEPPFWGRPGRPRPPGPPEAGYRRTELAARPRPRSTLQIGGAGSVGTASLRGMPALHRLRQAGWAVWPFDPWRPPVVAEVWPRLAIGALRKSDPGARRAWAADHAERLSPGASDAAAASADALDAVAAALWLWDRRGRTSRPVPELAEVRVLEGWIDGVVPTSVPDGAVGAPSGRSERPSDPDPRTATARPGDRPTPGRRPPRPRRGR